MEKLGRYLETIMDSPYAPPAEYCAKAALLLFKEVEEEMEVERGRTDAANLFYESMATNYTTLKALVREYLAAEKLLAGKLPPRDSRVRYVAAYEALRKAVE